MTSHAGPEPGWETLTEQHGFNLTAALTQPVRVNPRVKTKRCVSLHLVWLNFFLLNPGKRVNKRHTSTLQHSSALLMRRLRFYF